MKLSKLIALSAFGLIGLIVLLSSFTVVNPGERGVTVSFGKTQSEILSEGIHLKNPFATEVVKINIRNHKSESKSPLMAGSQENQSILIKWSTNWHVNGNESQSFYQELGYLDEGTISNLISSRVEERVKDQVSRMEANGILQKSLEIKSGVKTALSNDMAKYHIIIDDFVVTDIDYLPAYNAAIEAKVKAQQDAEAEKNRLEAVKYQAQQEVEKAKGMAEAQRLQQQSLTPELIQKMAIEKWNGVLPQYSGTTLPFVSLK